jgi:hypothetical protein
MSFDLERIGGEEQEHVQHVEEDRCRQEGGRAHIARAPKSLKVEHGEHD